MGNFKDKVALVGAGTTNKWGPTPDLDVWAMAAQALGNCLQDCGLKKEDIDGVVVGQGTGQPIGYDAMVEHLGLSPRFACEYRPGGRLFGPSIDLMSALVYSGVCAYCAFIYTNNARSWGRRFGGAGDEAGTSQMACAYGMTSPGAYLAMEFNRYMHRFGMTQKELGAIAVAQRKHAQLNPMALMKDRPLTIDDYMQGRYIVYPLRIYDYCMINDGAVVFVMAASERARDLRKAPVYVMGTGERAGYSHYNFDTDFGYPAYREAAEQVYEMAGIGPEDIDILYYYDAFSPFLLFMLEGFGFCNVGEAGGFVQGGRIEIGGQLPVNTSGGHLSEVYLQGRATLVEAVRQLRGECGRRQVKDAEIVQYIGSTPNASSFILRR
jgi:acetyl-CoA acetyltransferase